MLLLLLLLNKYFPIFNIEILKNKHELTDWMQKMLISSKALKHGDVKFLDSNWFLVLS